MLTNGIELLNDALKNHYAIAHFNINNLEWIKFILEEGEEMKTPLILGVSESAIKYMGGYKTVSSLVKTLLSDLKITIPIILHLDHATSFNSCKIAIDEGFTSVMIDGSSNSLEENIRITKEVVSYAHARNVSVEGEIGHVGGSEDAIIEKCWQATKEDCLVFCRETAIDTLAPALGSVHGLYKEAPNLNFKLMKDISDDIHIPLVLHGGTGIPYEQLTKAISCGICKININTELQVVWSKAVRAYLFNNQDVYDPRKIIKSGEIAMKSKIKELIKVMGFIHEPII